MKQREKDHFSVSANCRAGRMKREGQECPSSLFFRRQGGATLLSPSVPGTDGNRPGAAERSESERSGDRRSESKRSGDGRNEVNSTVVKRLSAGQPEGQEKRSQTRMVGGVGGAGSIPVPTRLGAGWIIVCRGVGGLHMPGMSCTISWITPPMSGNTVR